MTKESAYSRLLRVYMKLLDTALGPNSMCSLQVTVVPRSHCFVLFFPVFTFPHLKVEFIRCKFMVTIFLMIECGTIGSATRDENRRGKGSCPDCLQFTRTPLLH